MEEIEVTIQSILPSDESQGRFKIHVSPEATVVDLLKQLCKEAGTSLQPDYCLRSKDHDILNRTSTLAECELQDGAFLHWTSENVATRHPHCCRFLWFVAVASLIVGTVGILTICILRFKSDTPAYDFAIVFDAGSTHTAMFVYTWKASKYNGTAVATEFGSRCNVAGDGISGYVNDPHKAGESLQSCIDSAKAAIPASKHSSTPIYLGATAGMRLLRELNGTASKAILDSVHATFSKSPFKFENPLQSARIISGSEEGCFSWITSNYVANAFKVTRPEVIGVPAYTIVPSIGAMDLGGASTQITFVPQRGTIMPSNYQQVLQLFGQNYTVYTYSYLCYGVKEFKRQIFANYVLEQPTSIQIQHSCLPSGYSITKSYEEIFDSACIPHAPAVQAPNYTFVGSSNSKECSVAVRKALFNSSTCSYDSCSFSGIYQPQLSGPFYAFSSFFYVTSFLNLSNSNTSNFQHQQFVTAIEHICSSNWSQLQEIPVTTKQRKSLMFYCLQSTYINILLYEGYRVTDTLWPAIRFVEKIFGTEIGWTLGFVLNESNDYQTEQMPKVGVNSLTFSLLLAVFCLFLILGFILVIELKRARQVLIKRQVKMSRYGAI